MEHIEAGVTLADAVNFLVERYELVRTDRKGVYMAGADAIPDRYRYSQSKASYRINKYLNSSSLIPDFYLCTFHSLYAPHNAPAIPGRRVCFYG